jgi:hypothetical protein
MSKLCLWRTSLPRIVDEDPAFVAVRFDFEREREDLKTKDGARITISIPLRNDAPLGATIADAKKAAAKALREAADALA